MRNGLLLTSLLVLLGGAARVSAQGSPGYPVMYPQAGYGAAPRPGWPTPMPASPYRPTYPAYPAYGQPRVGAWPVNYQPATPAAGLPGRTIVPVQAAPAPPPEQAAPEAAETMILEGEWPGEPVVNIVGDNPGAPARVRSRARVRTPGHAAPDPVVPLPVPGTPLWGHDEGPPPEPEPLPSHTHPTPDHEPFVPDHGPPGYRFYGTADYLHWWIRKRTTPVLLTTGTPASPTVLVDDLDFDNQERSGARATFGVWLSQHQDVSLEVSGLWLGERTPTLDARAASLARPFIDARTGVPAFVILSAPGTQTGGAILEAPSRLWGGESNLRCELGRQPWGHIDVLAGFRYLRIEDALSIFDATTFAPGLIGVGGVSVLSSDRFGTRNQFWGGQLGLEAEFHCGPVFVDIWGKIALGSLDQVVQINGSTLLISSAGQRSAQPGGLLALPSNSGRFERNEFSYLPEFGINVGYQLSPHLRLRAGYTVLFVGNVVRAGDQIDPTINPTQRSGLLGGPPTLSGPARPLFAFRDTDFWAQGFNVGLEFRF